MHFSSTEACSVTLLKTVLPILLGLYCVGAVAQPSGEENEPTPEFLDATFSGTDAERVAAGFSDVIVERASQDDIGSMTDAAELVFRGTVQSQSYSYDELGVPSTSTTFAITAQLKGDHPADNITLVQPGGPSQSDSNQVLMVSNARYFAVGEEELLFVDGSSNNAVSPDQTNLLSRFRIYENKLYNDDGYGILLKPAKDGGKPQLIQSRDRNPAARFRRFNLGSHRMTKNFGGEDTDGPGTTRKPESNGVDVDTFSALIRN
jgi:hypothetical protein